MNVSGNSKVCGIVVSNNMNMCFLLKSTNVIYKAKSNIRTKNVIFLYEGLNVEYTDKYDKLLNCITFSRDK